MTHGAAGRVGTRGVNGNAPSAGAAPHCRVEPRVPQPLTPWGRVPRAARPSGTEPGSVPVSPGRGNAAPRLCRRLGLRSSPRTPPAPPKHPSPSRLCRRSPGRCHPAVFRTALSQLPLSAALFGPPRGAVRPYGGAPGGFGPGREHSGVGSGGTPEGGAGAGRGLWQSRGAATEPHVPQQRGATRHSRGCMAASERSGCWCRPPQ